MRPFHATGCGLVMDVLRTAEPPTATAELPVATAELPVATAEFLYGDRAVACGDREAPAGGVVSKLLEARRAQQ